ncbi:hypothetical protein NGM36_15935 [Streptomyces mutabilis]|uniref:hypothetical protein n=1 Tax=Streptomyces mutabilis TaxID=67332 RepID=UPI0022BA4910|nr:hypothetical protein [Streptomyces mutabilis]MCZ9351262.1 hypothetical protein [Streptomyces mutabilis]
MSSDVWSFAVDQDGLVIAEGPDGVEENVRLAFETLVIPFGTRAASVEDFLREWRRMTRDLGFGYTLGTSGAAVKRIDADHVEIGDLYGQFETCLMGAGEFENALERMLRFLEQRRSQAS